MDYILPTIFLGVSISVSCYYGGDYVKKCLSGMMMNMLDKHTKPDRSKVSFKTLGRSQSAIISFDHLGKQHKVCVPYDRKKSMKMLRKTVFLIKDNETEKTNKIDITHKPGIPYLLTPKQMGGIKIIVEKDNKILKEYTEDEIPEFLE